MRLLLIFYLNMICKVCETNESKYSWCVPCYILYKRMHKYGYEFKFLPEDLGCYRASSVNKEYIIIKK